MNDFWSILPELLLLGFTCVVLLVGLFIKASKSLLVYYLAIVALVIVIFLLGYQLANLAATSYTWNDMVVVDKLALALKLAATLCTIATLMYGKIYALERNMLNSNLYILLMFALLGIFVLISANNLLMIYLGLELLTLASYALVSIWRKNKLSLEAAMKYFVLGALASGFLLYGISMLYGVTGSLYLGAIASSLAELKSVSLIGTFALIFIVAGIGFKLGVVPFHMWVPDVYQGAPTNITLFIGSAPKLGAFAMVYRLLIETMPSLAFDWQQMLLVLAVLSLIIGNLAAIRQTNLKRMLAFSTIAQMAFVLLAIAVAGNSLPYEGANALVAAYGSALYYLIGYILTTLVTFGIILLLARDVFESAHIDDFAGLNQRSSLAAAIMAICMFSLAGIPPMLGFSTKFVVLREMIFTGSTMYLGLAIFAVLMSLIAAFYYLRIVKIMYFDKNSQHPTKFFMSTNAKIVLTVNGLLVLILGVFPQWLIDYCYNIMQATLI